MSLGRQTGFWLAALVAFGLFLYAFSSILVPFIAAIILAYLLDPLVDRCERAGMSRAFGTLLVIVIFVLLFVLALVAIVPLLVQQLTDLINRAPDYWHKLQIVLRGNLEPLLRQFGEGGDLKTVPSHLASSAGEGAKWLGSWAGGLASSLLSGGQALLGLLSLLVITPVVAFYLLLDWDHMVAKVDSWLPRKHQDTLRQLAREMNASVYGFLRGQATICLILGTFYALSLSLTGLHFGFLIGVMSGILNFIPYVGSTTGLVVAVGVAITQFPPDWWMVAIVAVIFIAGQFVDGNILQPKFLGEAVGLHAVWLMFALLGAGSLLGFSGVMIAVPLAGAIGVLVRFFLGQYLKSPFYLGHAVSHEKREDGDVLP